MTPEQRQNLERHQTRINEQGERLYLGTIPWLVSEAQANLERVLELIGPKHDRVSKKMLKPILMDLRDQLRELGRRF